MFPNKHHAPAPRLILVRLCRYPKINSFTWAPSIRASIFATVLGLSLLANALGLGLGWRHLTLFQPPNARLQPALDVTLYNQLSSRFQRLPVEPCRLLVLGDSIPYALALDLEDRKAQGDLASAWEPILSQRLTSRCIPSVTTLGLEKMLQTIHLPPAKDVFIWVGINDLMSGGTPVEVATNYEDIIARVRVVEPASRITLISVLPNRDGVILNSSVRTLNHALMAMAAKTGSNFLDVRTAVTDSAGFLDPRLAALDGIHPNFAGLARLEALLQETSNPTAQAVSISSTAVSAASK